MSLGLVMHNTRNKCAKFRDKFP